MSEWLWAFLAVGYLTTVAVEVPVLILAMDPSHPLRRRVLTGLWLTACTYPMVVLVLPALFASRTRYLLAAETFAPAAECLLLALVLSRFTRRDLAAVVAANLISFVAGEWLMA